MHSEHVPLSPTTSMDMADQVSCKYRIYGDNILECERTLNLMAEAMCDANTLVEWTPSALYAPCYRVSQDGTEIFTAQLFPGYGRWGYDVQSHLRRLGAPLREATDAVVLRLERLENGSVVASPILCFEFCGALPAGNNAWQRCGRALACAYAEVPYLYYAELGGMELNVDRKIRAPRFPNPIVPFAYLCLSQTTGSAAVPVFTGSPSISEDVSSVFLNSLGEVEALDVIRDILTGMEDTGPSIAALQRKATQAVQALAEHRKRKNTLRGDEWAELAKCVDGADKAAWLLKRKLKWKKKVSITSMTQTLPLVLKAAVNAEAVGPGASDLPMCLLGNDDRLRFSSAIQSIFGSKVSRSFLDWLSGNGEPLVIAWICGFKPGGDDSRPDRGLLPMARMIFGAEKIQYLTVVYGPAKPVQWTMLAKDMNTLAEANGLWQSIIRLSNGILVDSSTATSLQNIGFLTSVDSVQGVNTASLPDPLTRPTFGEHDVDTILHSLFSNAAGLDVFEGMCNPPGGDWSGISFQSSADGEILRWTSLPRVSLHGAKRPDHVVVFHGSPLLLLVIESKGPARSVETGIGPRLSHYVQEIYGTSPNVVRAASTKGWGPYTGTGIQPKYIVVSGAAFQFSKQTELAETLARGEVDVVLALEFVGGEEKTLIHFTSTIDAAWVGKKLQKLCTRFGGRVEVQIY